MLFCNGRFVYLYVFFFKQKTAYEMRISDWSSDVCSSDLQHDRGEEEEHADAGDLEGLDQAHLQGPGGHAESELLGYRLPRRIELDPDVGREDRKSVV